MLDNNTILSAFPGKDFFGRFEDTTVQFRKTQFEKILNECCNHERISTSDVFLKFIGINVEDESMDSNITPDEVQIDEAFIPIPIEIFVSDKPLLSFPTYDLKDINTLIEKLNLFELSLRNSSSSQAEEVQEKFDECLKYEAASNTFNCQQLSLILDSLNNPWCRKRACMTLATRLLDFERYDIVLRNFENQEQEYFGKIFKEAALHIDNNMPAPLFEQGMGTPQFGQTNAYFKSVKESFKEKK